MSARLCRTLFIVGLLLGLGTLALAQNKSLVSVPAGTKIMPPKYAEDQPPQASLEKDSGLGRLCTLGELIRGVQTPDGRVLGLSVTPVKDTNYRYEIMIIGNDCVIQAVPRLKGFGGFAMLGSPSRSLGSFYYSSSADMTQAVKLIEMGYEGNGFVR